MIKEIYSISGARLLNCLFGGVALIHAPSQAGRVSATDNTGENFITTANNDVNDGNNSNNNNNLILHDSFQRKPRSYRLGHEHFVPVPSRDVCQLPPSGL